MSDREQIQALSNGAINMKEQIGEYYPIEGLVPHPKNPRHNDEAVSQIARSIERFGFTSPIIAREQDKTIIAGHTRWKAAKQIGLSKVPVIFVNLSAKPIVTGKL